MEQEAYSSVVDSSGMYFQSYKSNLLDFDSICMNKAISCAGNSANSTSCVKNQLSSTCLSQLNNMCIASGLYDLIDNTAYGNNFTLVPAECDINQLQTTPNSTAFYASCFNYLLNNFLIEGINFNANNIVNMDKTIFANANATKRNRVLRPKRLLQTANATNTTNTTTTTTTTTTTPNSTNNTSVIVSDGSDPTANDTIANSIRTITITPSSITVNGIAPNSTINQTSLQSALNQVNASSTGNNNNNNNGGNPTGPNTAGTFTYWSMTITLILLAILL